MMRVPAADDGRPRRVLVVDDDRAHRELVVAVLRGNGYEAEWANGADALDYLAREAFDAVLLDVGAPGRTVVDLLFGTPPGGAVPVIVMTADDAVHAIAAAAQYGAHQCLRKPLGTGELLRALERAIDPPAGAHPTGEDIRRRMLGESPAMATLWKRIEQVAPTMATVLITGETGTGKQLVAQAVHALSPRAHRAFVTAGEAWWSEFTVGSDPFGHDPEGFAGSSHPRLGAFEEAGGGTLFLDHVDAMPPGLQARLLHVVQPHADAQRGAAAPVRLIAATNADLLAEVARGTFREDLFYRLNAFPIRVPALRERRDDIPLLAAHFLRRAARSAGVAPPELPAATLTAMRAYEWPGNVRQLEHFLERAVIAGQRTIEFDPSDALLPPAAVRPPAAPARPPDLALAATERQRILEVLDGTNGHRGRAAALLGIDRRTLYRKLRRYEAEGECPGCVRARRAKARYPAKQ